jgi:hypothetical protein
VILKQKAQDSSQNTFQGWELGAWKKKHKFMGSVFPPLSPAVYVSLVDIF